MTPEQKLNKWIADTFADCDVQRIETLTGNGVPDFNICWMSHEFWVESKVLRPDGGLWIRKEQYAWGMRRHKYGGSIFIVAGDESELFCVRFPVSAKPIDGTFVEVRAKVDNFHFSHYDRVTLRKFILG